MSSSAPLIFLNAFPLDQRQWESVLGLLIEQYSDLGDVITFDVPGLGITPASPEEPSLKLIGDAAVAAMREATGATSAIWVGCSMGGYVAGSIAKHHPQAIAGLVLLDTKAEADSAEAAAGREAMATKTLDLGHHPDPSGAASAMVGVQGSSRQSIVTWVEQNIAGKAAEGIAWSQRAMARRDDTHADFAALDVPVAVARGENDGITSAESATKLAHAVGTQVVTIPDAGHLPALENPRAVVDLVVEVLRSAS